VGSSPAVYVADHSGIPELRQLAPKILSKGSVGSDSKLDAAGLGIAKDMLVRSKMSGSLAIIGAVAGILEDANVHKAAGLVYDLAEKMGVK
jgi:hypothetical protein